MTALPQAVPAGRSPVRAAILDALAWSMDAIGHITGDAARAQALGVGPVSAVARMIVQQAMDAERSEQAAAS